MGITPRWGGPPDRLGSTTAARQPARCVLPDYPTKRRLAIMSWTPTGILPPLAPQAPVRIRLGHAANTHARQTTAVFLNVFSEDSYAVRRIRSRLNIVGVIVMSPARSPGLELAG